MGATKPGHQLGREGEERGQKIKVAAGPCSWTAVVIESHTSTLLQAPSQIPTLLLQLHKMFPAASKDYWW